MAKDWVNHTKKNVPKSRKKAEKNAKKNRKKHKNVHILGNLGKCEMWKKMQTAFPPTVAATIFALFPATVGHCPGPGPWQVGWGGGVDWLPSTWCTTVVTGGAVLFPVAQRRLPSQRLFQVDVGAPGSCLLGLYWVT